LEPFQKAALSNTVSNPNDDITINVRFPCNPVSINRPDTRFCESRRG
jgi:hypothetical protein